MKMTFTNKSTYSNFSTMGNTKWSERTPHGRISLEWNEDSTGRDKEYPK